MSVQKYMSYYMEFDNEYTGKLNKYGGVPTHLPSKWPAEKDGEKWSFICQLYCDSKMLSIPDTLCIQIYQYVKDGVEGSDPIIVQVPIGAVENVDKIGIANPRLQEGDINFKEVCEEIIEKKVIEESYDENGVYLLTSKLKGWYHYDKVTPNNFLGLIEDGDNFSPFNWGCGYNLVMYVNETNEVKWEFY